MYCWLTAPAVRSLAMSHSAPTDPTAPDRWTTEQYLHLVDEGVLGPDDKVELLEGVIVAMAPSNAPHAAGVARATRALVRAVGDRASGRAHRAGRATRRVGSGR